jgi:hypothetical protein
VRLTLANPFKKNDVGNNQQRRNPFSLLGMLLDIFNKQRCNSEKLDRILRQQAEDRETATARWKLLSDGITLMLQGIQDIREAVIPPPGITIDLGEPAPKPE